MPLRFEWDPRKAKANERKHGVAFDEAATVLADPLAATIADPDHSSGDEERFVTIGVSSRGRAIIIAYEDKEDIVRIISARKATPRERRLYEEGT